MGFKKNNPGCNCCAGCTIASDDFNRSNNSDITISAPASWTVDSGTWDITSNQLRCTAAGNIHCNTTHPDGDPSSIVEGTIKISAAGNSADILVGWSSTTSYYYARYTAAAVSPTVAIRSRSGGTHTTLATVTLTNGSLTQTSTHSFKVCVDSAGKITAYLDGGGVVEYAAGLGGAAQFGLGGTGGTITFDDVVFSKAQHTTTAESCEVCSGQCVQTASAYNTCCDDSIPTDMDVTIPSGMFSDPIPGGCGCQACGNANVGGTYTLTLQPATTTYAGCTNLGNAPVWLLQLPLFSSPCASAVLCAGSSIPNLFVELTLSMQCIDSGAYNYQYGFGCEMQLTITFQGMCPSNCYTVCFWNHYLKPNINCATDTFSLNYEAVTNRCGCAANTMCTYTDQGPITVVAH